MPSGNSYSAIFAAVKRIPPGCVATYGQVAREAGLGQHARLVGYALHNCPRDVPWHRVINARGRISLPADSSSGMTQRRRLIEEGVMFVGPRVDLERFGWRPGAASSAAPDQ